MPRGDKSKYTDKQKRKAEHIEESYEERGVPEEQAERRAWATVNKESGGGNKSGSGRGVPDTHVSSEKGGKKGARPPRRGPRPPAPRPPRRPRPPAPRGTLGLGEEGRRHPQAQPGGEVGLVTCRPIAGRTDHHRKQSASSSFTGRARLALAGRRCVDGSIGARVPSRASIAAAASKQRSSR